MPRNPEKSAVTRSQAKPLLATIARLLIPKLPSNPSLPIQRPGLITRVRYRRTSAPTHVCRRIFCVCITVQWRLCVGDLRVCRVPVSPVYQPAHSCHPFV
jgi:hypothetical protein